MSRDGICPAPIPSGAMKRTASVNLENVAISGSLSCLLDTCEPAVRRKTSQSIRCRPLVDVAHSIQKLLYALLSVGKIFLFRVENDSKSQNEMVGFYSCRFRACRVCSHLKMIWHAQCTLSDAFLSNNLSGHLCDCSRRGSCRADGAVGGRTEAGQATLEVRLERHFHQGYS